MLRADDVTLFLVQPGLHRSIAWDLIIVLLPYLDSPFPPTVQVAESLIHLAAETGNPREVYVKILQGLSSLSWVPRARSGADDYYEDDGENEEDGDDDGDGGEDGNDAAESSDSESEHATSPADQAENPVLPALRALARFKTLLSALCLVHPRISARFPSKFLSTELSTLSVVFTNAVETVNARVVTDMVEQLLAFVKIAGPPPTMLAQQAPPRTPAPAGSSPVASDSDPERLLQIRLTSSFLSNLLSTYVLRTRQPSSLLDTPPPPGFTAPPIVPAKDGVERGFEMGWAGMYDELVLRPEKSIVPGGRTAIDQERENRAAHRTAKAIVDEICLMCEQLGLQTEELLQVCLEGAGVFFILV